MLANKNILVGVTGSIAIYKSLELIRLYIKAGANVKVIMTDGAKKFIAPLTFETISQQNILDENSENWDKNSINNHIAIGKWADIFVIAPATANTINKISNGLADNLLLQTALAYPRIKIIAPAANTNMIENPLTQASLKMLKLCNYEIISPVSKELACKDIGNGAMADIDDIFDTTARELLKDEFWSNRKIIVTAGGTIEKIDDARCITNFSSGKMGTALAKALYLKGSDVCLIKTSSVKEKVSSQIHIIEVQNAQEMYNFSLDSIRIAQKGVLTKSTLMDKSNVQLIQKKPFFFSVAAVSDYTPTFSQTGKIKKEDIGENWDLKLKKNIDILDSIPKENLFAIGFKAEMDTKVGKQNARNMLNTKKLDAVCLNFINEQNNFGSNENEIEVIFNSVSKVLQKNTKLNIAFEILDTLKNEFKQ
jgi:phosphopantothenoylcysteine decarboxylase/phosphopantothenate--cysteine ligase